jgi:outer membrane protein
MKKMMMVLALMAGIGFGAVNSAQAQAIKIGYFDLDAMISIMPGAEKLDSIMQNFVRDSINAEYEFRVEEFNRMDSTLRADSAKTPPKLYQERKQKLFQEFYLLQNWQEYSQQMYQQKQQELVAPLARLAIDAFKKVVAEEKYTHVFKGDSLYEAPDSDNLLPKVAKKLNIKVPPELMGGGM